MALLQKIVNGKSYLNQAMTKILSIFRSQEFASFLTASGLNALTAVHKGYPNVNSSSVTEYEAWVNTSSTMNCEVWDAADGVDVLIIVDIYLPDSDLKYIWKYADATLQWLWQFNMKSLALVDMNTRIYAKAAGDTANHFTLSVHLLADMFIDSDIPTIEDGE